MPHRPRGAYIGGHTVIGPGSGWFSKPKTKIKAKKPKPLSPQEVAKRQQAKEEGRRRGEEQRRRAKEERRERQRNAEENVAAKRAARIAARNSPEAKAKQKVEAVARRQQLEAKMAKITVVKRPLAPRASQRKRIAADQSPRRGLSAAVGGRSSRSRHKKKNRTRIPAVKRGAAGTALAEALTLSRGAGEPALAPTGRGGGQLQTGADNGIVLFTAFGRFAAG